MHAAKVSLTTRGRHDNPMRRGGARDGASRASPAPAAIRVDYATATLSASGTTLRKGDIITIDGSTGQGVGRKGRDDRTGAVRRILDPDGMGRQRAQAQVRANADTPNDAASPSGSGPRASGCAARSTCSSKRIVSVRSRE